MRISAITFSTLQSNKNNSAVSTTELNNCRQSSLIITHYREQIHTPWLWAYNNLVIILLGTCVIAEMQKFHFHAAKTITSEDAKRERDREVAFVGQLHTIKCIVCSNSSFYFTDHWTMIWPNTSHSTVNDRGRVPFPCTHRNLIFVV